MDRNCLYERRIFRLIGQDTEYVYFNGLWYLKSCGGLKEWKWVFF